MIDIVPNWHPIWVHFPIALLSLATVLFLAGRMASEPLGPSLTSAARWNLVVGVVLLVPTLLTGYWAYNSVAHDGAGHAAMERHRLAALIAAGCFMLAAILAWLDRYRHTGGSVPLLIVLLAGTVAVGGTGYLGAENVYRHGLGVERLPEGVMESRIESALAQRLEEDAGGNEASRDEPSGDEPQARSEEKTEQDNKTVPEGHEGHDHPH